MQLPRRVELQENKVFLGLTICMPYYCPIFAYFCSRWITHPSIHADVRLAVGQHHNAAPAARWTSRTSLRKFARVGIDRRADQTSDPGRAALHTGRNHTGPQFPHIHSHEISLQALGGNQLHILSNCGFVKFDRIGIFNELYVSQLQFLIKACCIVTTNRCKWPSFLVKRRARAKSEQFLKKYQQKRNHFVANQSCVDKASC